MTTRTTRSPRRQALRIASALAIGVGATIGLAACGNDPAPAGNTAAAPATAATGLTIDNGWAKAGSGMTAAFGTLRNPTDAPITIVSGSSPEIGMVQLHTMEKQPDGSMKMTEKKGGFVIPAGGTHELTPGGDHIMLMELPKALVSGDDIHLTMKDAGGASYTWTVPVRSFAGADETYKPEMTH